jgi:signal recognition particle subunit SRP14
MVLLQPDPFLNELHKMYERHKASGTIYVTIKRSSLKPRRAKTPAPPEAYQCLVRASDGKKHVSTVVPASQHVKFASAMNVIMKAHMEALKQSRKEKKPGSSAKAGASSKEGQH